MTYEEYEKECERIREINESYLDIFANDMEGRFKPRTITRHIHNIAFYLNIYLLHEEPKTMQDGIYMIDFYFGEFFIRKCAWSTPDSIRLNAASIKKFYKCMAELGKVDAREYALFAAEVREGVPDWQQECVEFNDPDWEPEW